MHAIRARNRLLIAAALCIVLVFVDGFPMRFLREKDGLPWLALVPLGGFIMALGLRHLAPVFLDGPAQPWYARRHTLLYLALWIPTLQACLTASIVKFLGPRAYAFAGPVAYWVAYTGCTLLWIPLNDWVSAPTPRSPRWPSQSMPSRRLRAPSLSPPAFHQEAGTFVDESSLHDRKEK